MTCTKHSKKKYLSKWQEQKVQIHAFMNSYTRKHQEQTKKQKKTNGNRKGQSIGGTKIAIRITAQTWDTEKVNCTNTNKEQQNEAGWSTKKKHTLEEISYISFV